MKDKKMILAAFLMVSTFLGSFGQLFFKLGLNGAAGYQLGLGLSQSVLLTVVAYIAAGAFVYVIATVIYLYILGRTNLSWAYGFVGFGYVFTTILAFLVLGEPVGLDKWIGVIVIAVGTALIGMS